MNWRVDVWGRIFTSVPVYTSNKQKSKQSVHSNTKIWTKQHQRPTKTKNSNLGQNEGHSLWLFTKYYILGLVWWNDSVVKAVDDTADVVAAS